MNLPPVDAPQPSSPGAFSRRAESRTASSSRFVGISCQQNRGNGEGQALCSVFGCVETDRVSVVVLRLVFQATTRRASRCLVLRGFSSLVPTELAQHLLSSVHRSVWPVVTACQTWCAGRKTPPAFPQLAKVINRDRSNPRLEHRTQGLTPAKLAPDRNSSPCSAMRSP